MNRKLTIIIGIVFLVAVAGFLISFFVFDMGKVEKKPAALENAEQGYSVTYPAGLEALEYTPDMITVGRPFEGGIDGVADLRVQIVEGTEGESFSDAAVRDLRVLCDADGPDSSFSCPVADSIVPFTADGGAEGFEIFLKGTLLDRLSGETTDSLKGPYYVFPLDGGATATRTLFVHAPLNLSAEESDAAAIRAIAASVKVTPAETAPAE